MAAGQCGEDPFGHAAENQLLELQAAQVVEIEHAHAAGFSAVGANGAFGDGAFQAAGEIFERDGLDAGQWTFSDQVERFVEFLEGLAGFTAVSRRANGLGRQECLPDRQAGVVE